MTISATDILVPVCSKIPLLYLLTQKVAQKFGYVLGIKNQHDAIRRHVDDPCTAKHRTWVVTGIKKDGTAAKRWYKLTFVSESGFYAF